MSFNRSMFSSASDDWSTPKGVYDALDKEFHFTDYPCPLKSSEDGLKREWGTSTFVNPPYSKIKEWVFKAWEESLKDKVVVMLIPSRTDTKWWHDYVLPYAKEIRFIRGRLKFSGAKNSAPFPSCIIVFEGENGVGVSSPS